MIFQTSNRPAADAAGSLMSDRPYRRAARLFVSAAALLALVGGGDLPAQGLNLRETVKFAAEMAQRGNWREAKFRWERVAELQPDNHKILNNLAVAFEVLGDPDTAKDYYARAAELSQGNLDIEDNRRRFAYFWRRTGAGGEQETGDGTMRLPSPLGGGGNQKGKTFRVSVGLPVPARLDLEGRSTLLVTSFLTRETNLLDTNRELVKFLRGEFKKRTDLDVLNVVPPPAIPEQTVEDLLANLEFWRHLGRNYGADLIVSGVVKYDQEDISSFQDVDIISESTGQKVRRTQFVEQEQFRYELEIFFIDGVTGALLFRDRMERSVIFRGLTNDPIGAFYAMSDSITADVLAVVTTRIREDTRVIFRK